MVCHFNGKRSSDGNSEEICELRMEVGLILQPSKIVDSVEYVVFQPVCLVPVVDAHDLAAREVEMQYQ